MNKEGHYSYKELKDNKVKYSDMSACEQGHYKRGLDNEFLEFIMFYMKGMIGIILISIILCFLSLIIFLS